VDKEPIFTIKPKFHWLYHIFNWELVLFIVLGVPLGYLGYSFLQNMQVFEYKLIVISAIFLVGIPYFIKLIVTYIKIKNTIYVFYEKRVEYKCNCFYKMERIITYDSIENIRLCKNKIKNFWDLGRINLEIKDRNILFGDDDRYFLKNLRNFIIAEYEFNGIVIDNVERFQEIYEEIQEIVEKVKNYRANHVNLPDGYKEQNLIVDLQSEQKFIYKLIQSIVNNFFLLVLACLITIYAIKNIVLLQQSFTFLIVGLGLFYIAIGHDLLLFYKQKSRYQTNKSRFYEDFFTYTDSYKKMVAKYENVLSAKWITAPLYNLSTFSFVVDTIDEGTNSIGTTKVFLECAKVSNEVYDKIKHLLCFR